MCFHEGQGLIPMMLEAAHVGKQQGQGRMCSSGGHGWWLWHLRVFTRRVVTVRRHQRFVVTAVLELQSPRGLFSPSKAQDSFEGGAIFDVYFNGMVSESGKLVQL